MTNSIRKANWIHMTSDEEIIWVGLPSMWTIAMNVIIGLVLIIIGISLTVAFGIGLPWVPEAVAGVLTFAPLLLAVFGVMVIAIPLVLLRHTRYVITSEELYRKEGFLRKDVENIRHDRIQNTNCNQSLIERIFSFGDILIYTAGTDTSEITLWNVPHPQQVRGTLAEVLDAAADDSGTAGSSPAQAQVDRTAPSDTD